MSYGICELCEKPEEVHEHHLVPKNVLKLRNPNSKLYQLKVNVCHECHKEIHNAFLNHLISLQKFDGYNRIEAIKYLVLKQFLKRDKHKKVWEEWMEYSKDIINNWLKEFNDENDKEE
jgi:hypothetical protein